MRHNTLLPTPRKSSILNGMRRFNIQVMLFTALLTGVFSLAPLQAGGKYVPKDFSIEFKTKGFPGAKAHMSARLDAPVEAVWEAILDTNKHAKLYPRMKRSFCITEEHVLASKQDGLRNGATVKHRYAKKKCDPHVMRKPGEVWSYHIFQEFDYPFPVSDRWIMAETINDESNFKKGVASQKGLLIYGRQKIYEFELTVESHPKYPGQTRLGLFIWTDPGGFIADWMIREATEIVAPKFMEVLEQQGRLKARGETADHRP